MWVLLLLFINIASLYVIMNALLEILERQLLAVEINDYHIINLQHLNAMSN